MTLRSAEHWQGKRLKNTQGSAYSKQCLQVFTGMKVYKNFTTKISTFHARVFDASKIKIYLLKQRQFTYSFGSIRVY